MNLSLTKELNNEINAKQRRFDDKELIGKTVAHAIYEGEVAGISFTDGTWCAVEAYVDYDDNASVMHVDALDIYSLHGLGLITDAQLEGAKTRERENSVASKLAQIERLKSDIEYINKR